MSNIFIKIIPGVMRKILDIQQLQSEQHTDLFYGWNIEFDHLLDISLDLMLKTMKKEIKERK